MVQTILKFQGVRQAASEGAFKIWGRLIHSKFESLVRNNILSVVPLAHWTDYEIEAPSFIDAADNFRVSTYRPGQPSQMGGYCDLCADENLITKWLPSEGARLLSQVRSKMR